MPVSLSEIRAAAPGYSGMSDDDMMNHLKTSGVDVSNIIVDTPTHQVENDEAGGIRSYGSIPVLKGVSGIGGALGYGLEAAGFNKAGRSLQDSDQRAQEALTARQSKQAQEDARKTLIDDNGNYGGYNLGTLAQDVAGAVPGTLAMGLAGVPMAGLASAGSKALGLGEKVAGKLSQIAGSGALGKATAKGIDTAIGSAVGFGASEGAFSGASNAAQVQNEIRQTDINKLSEHPAFLNVYHHETDKSLTVDQRLYQARDLLARKAGDDVFADTLVKTGAISMATGGGVFGMLRGNAVKEAAGEVTDSALTKAAKGFVTEGLLQEAPQSALEQRTMNQAKQDYVDQNQDLNQGVLNAGLQGGIAGGVMGLFGAASVNTPAVHENDKKAESPSDLTQSQSQTSENKTGIPSKDTIVFADGSQISANEFFNQRMAEHGDEAKARKETYMALNGKSKPVVGIPDQVLAADGTSLTTEDLIRGFTANGASEQDALNYIKKITEIPVQDRTEINLNPYRFMQGRDADTANQADQVGHTADDYEALREREAIQSENDVKDSGYDNNIPFKPETKEQVNQSWEEQDLLNEKEPQRFKNKADIEARRRLLQSENVNLSKKIAPINSGITTESLTGNHRPLTANEPVLSENTESSPEISANNGQPFKSEGAARLTQKRQGLQQSHVVKLVEGGFVLQPLGNQHTATIDQSAHEAATSPHNDLPEPTPAQKEAGNYKKGHINLHGLNITIENPRGSKRSGTDNDGKLWSVDMAHHYGYIKRTEGADGDHVDVFIGNNPDSQDVFVVNQTHPKTGEFDEHKVMLGFNSQEEAKSGYLANYAKGWRGGESITRMTMDRFKQALQSGVLDKPIKHQPNKQPAETKAYGKNSESQPNNTLEQSSNDQAIIGQNNDLLQRSATPSQLDDSDMQAALQSNFHKAGHEEQSIKQTEVSSDIAQTAETSHSKETESKKINDFGEKIGGAKKDLWSGIKDRLNEVKDDKIAVSKLSEIWPQPDYQGLIDGGISKESVALIRAMRDEIPVKPRASWKLKNWAAQVKELRQFANDILDGTEHTPAVIKAELENGGDKLRGLVGRAELYELLGHEKSLSGIRLMKHYYSLYKGKENVTLWAVERDAAATAFSSWPKELATGDTRQEAIDAFKGQYDSLNEPQEVKKGVSFDIFSERGKTGFYIGKKIGRHVAKLEGPFDTVKAAREYRNNNATALEETLAKYKEIPQERRSVNEPRVGSDMRNGQDVTPEFFAETFGFRGVEFGNWVEQKRRQKDLNDAFDALLDMAAILDIPAKAISLNGQLGLAFGARGSGGVNPASAHYEPGNVVINLTKRTGAGSLGHEWWHALDNYFARQREAGDYMTTAQDVSLASRGAQYQPYAGIRPEMIEAFGAVVNSIKQTEMKDRSFNLDKKRSKEYWTTEQEMSARAFEAYLISKLEDQEASNDYLANIVSEEAWNAAALLGMENENSYPYPTNSELPSIRAGFDQFFQVIEHKKTEAGVVLYRKTDEIRHASASVAEGSPKGISVALAQKIANRFMQNYNNNIPLKIKVVENQEDIYGPESTVGNVGRIKGAYHSKSGVFVLVASNLDNIRDGEDTIRHEILGHYGLNTFKREDKQAILKKIISSKNNPGLKALWKKVDLDYADKSEWVKAEEVFAKIAEQPDGMMNRAIDYLASLINRALRHVGLIKSRLTSSELRSIVRSISDGIRSGSTTQQTFLTSDNDQFNQESDVHFRLGSAEWIKTAQERAYKEIVGRLSTSKTFNVWHKTVGTQFHKAMIDPHFGQVFNASMAFEQDTARFANEAADMAPLWLPKTEGIVGAANELKNGWKRSKDGLAVGDAIFETTLRDRRLSDDELKGLGYSPVQRQMYQEFFAAVNKSLDDLAKSEMFRMARALNLAKAPDNMSVNETANWYAAESADPKAGKDFLDKADAIIKLKKQGYAPLMRFGRYTVDVAENGERQFFGLFETEKEAQEMKRVMQEQYPDANVTKGVMSENDWQMFKDVNPETMEVFARMMNVDQESAFQEYLKIAVNNRSAMKRLIHRKKMPGFVKDAQRVLASFITSNAKATSKNYHMGDMVEAIASIPKSKGDVIDEAVELYNYVQNPAAAGAKLRGLLFTWYLGGSAASAMVNMTQTFTTTLPYLHQFGDTKHVATILGNAMRQAAVPKILKGDMAAALNRADEEGITAPHELHMLYNESMRTSVIQNRFFRPLGKAWGSLFSVAEAYNRRVAFIAAYQLAKEKKMADPFGFATQAVEQTQFVYSKASRPNWARSTVGSTVFTFKTFTINYLEFLKRLPGPERAVALGVLILFAGLSGLPGSDDLDDVLDTIGQALGYNTNSKAWKDRALTTLLGRELANFALYGASAFTPFDVSQRLSVGNIIPGTALLKKTETDKSRDAMEFAGPAGSFIQKGTEAFEAATSHDSLTSKIKPVSKAVLPKAFGDAIQSYDMATHGYYPDTKGRKVADTDKSDAFLKLIGLQPSSVAEPRRQERYLNQDVAMVKAVKSDINELWASGLVEHDPDKIEEAKRMFKDWNSKNPDTPIRLNMHAIANRAKQMRLTSGQRLLKTSPKEMRGYAKQVLSD